MRFDIRYTSQFSYDEAISESQNELRACPTSDARQQVSHYRVTTTPSSRMHSYTDYWGTRVDTFGIRQPHTSLEVVAESTVETWPPQMLAASPRRRDLAAPEFRDEHLEFLARSPHVDWTPEVQAEAERCLEHAGDDVVNGILSIHRTIGTGFTYVPNSTYVGVDVASVHAAKEGVCQDFAHVVIAMYRSVGIPARYVSGYFFARSDSVGDEPDETEIDVQTHAWVEAAVPGHGWLALDPTNAQQVGQRHIKIGHGRDYDDVAPLKGTYTGAATHALLAGVHIRRMAAAAQQQQ